MDTKFHYYWEKITVILFKVIMPAVTAILLFVFSTFVARPYFGKSQNVDLLARVFLWFLFTLIYWSIPIGYERRKKSPINILSFHKTRAVLATFLASAIGAGGSFWFLTFWVINTFIPLFADYKNLLGFGNGLLYAIFVFYQYYMLPSKNR